MAKIKFDESQMVTANDIKTGRPLFMMADGRWSPSPTDAHLSENATDSERLLAMAMASNARAEVELVNLIAGAVGADGKPWPQRNREIIRAFGPTILNPTIQGRTNSGPSTSG